VLSDPRAVKCVIKDYALSFNKGMLAEILEPILGTGLIPADIPVRTPTLYTPTPNT